MSQSGRPNLHSKLAQLAADDDATAPTFVEFVLREAVAMGASDVHLQPTARGLQLAWRRQGVLEPIGMYDAALAPRVVARLKVLAGLLTYEQQLPQEGRIRESVDGVQMRLSTFPTVHGERAVVRLFAAPTELLYIDELGFPDDLAHTLLDLVQQRHGMAVICGPAGSGKTTTAYALMRELTRYHGGRVSLMSIEDPVESHLEGVAQSQVHAPSGFTLDAGLRSLLRQDPEVILAGEIRDPESAALVFRAALTGHFVITTFHAGSTAEAVRRLVDMGIPTYMLRSGIRAVVHQTLLRELCSECGKWIDAPLEMNGMRLPRQRIARGCNACDQTGYGRRFPVGESFPLSLLHDPAFDLAHADAKTINQDAQRRGMVDRWTRALQAVQSGLTSEAEVRRVMGWEETSSGEEA